MASNFTGHLELGIFRRNHSTFRIRKTSIFHLRTVYTVAATIQCVHLRFRVLVYVQFGAEMSTGLNRLIGMRLLISLLPGRWVPLLVTSLITMITLQFLRSIFIEEKHASYLLCLGDFCCHRNRCENRGSRKIREKTSLFTAPWKQ